MGACLEPTPEMGEWSVEVRRESAYLAGSGYNAHAFEGGPEPRHAPRVLWYGESPAAFAIPTEDAGKVLAALDQMLSHPAYRKDSGPRIVGAWSANAAGNLIELSGPFEAAGSREPWAVHEAVELPYSSLTDLRNALAPLVGLPNPEVLDAERRRIRARLLKELKKAVERMREPLRDGETFEDRKREVWTGEEEPGVFQVRDKYQDGAWKAWAYDPEGGSRVIVVTEQDLVEFIERERDEEPIHQASKP